MSALGVSALGLIGKVPSQGDYVRIRAQRPEFMQLEEWLSENVDFALSRARPQWDYAVQHGGIQAFVLRPPSTPANVALAGAIAPSGDRAGRRFPVVAAASLALSTELAASAHLLPLLLEEAWQASSSLVIESTNPDADVHALLEGNPAQSWIELAEVSGDYLAWSQELRLSELWALVHPTPTRDALSYTLRFLGEAIRPWLGKDQAKTPLTLRLPLGQAGGAALCFWLDLVRRLARWQHKVPSYFWSHDGQAGTLLLHLGEPPKSTLAELWAPSSERDEFCDLQGVGPAQHLPPLAPAFENVLHDQATVADLLAVAASR
ncbi:MAG TPA: type VI secretion system-associated protein TagF [Polyangiaceae bacterium]|nr:type VI secretion system-associated protein TagF [Polyangiaceae bacterium]